MVTDTSNTQADVLSGEGCSQAGGALPLRPVHHTSTPRYPAVRRIVVSSGLGRRLLAVIGMTLPAVAWGLVAFLGREPAQPASAQPAAPVVVVVYKDAPNDVIPPPQVVVKPQTRRHGGVPMRLTLD